MEYVLKGLGWKRRKEEKTQKNIKMQHNKETNHRNLPQGSYATEI